MSSNPYNFSAPTCNLCPDLESLPQFAIYLAAICNLCPDLKSLCADFKSPSRFLIFLPRFEIPKAAPICNPSCPDLESLKHAPIFNPPIVPFCNP